MPPSSEQGAQGGSTGKYPRPSAEPTPGAGDQEPTVISNRAPLNVPAIVDIATPALGPRLTPGMRLAQFELLQLVGGGGMGRVFRAMDTALARVVAVKILSREQATDPETLARFRNEAQSAARLNHENIIQVYHLGEHEELPYIVFEYIDGPNLRVMVEQRGALPLADALSYTFQVAKALAHMARSNVVHRDIKPSNVLVTANGRVKLIDMGLARLRKMDGDPDLTASGVTLGTFDYISPEQARDPRTADARSDIYSLGCTFFYILAGRPPFPEGTVLQKLLQHQGEEPPDVREFRPDVPEQVSHLLGKMMAKDPRRRFQTPEELIAALAQLADEIGMFPLEPGDRIWTRPGSSPLSLLHRHLPWMAPVAVLIAIVLLLDNLFWSRPPQPLEPAMGSGRETVVAMSANPNANPDAASAAASQSAANETEKPRTVLPNAANKTGTGPNSTGLNGTNPNKTEPNGTELSGKKPTPAKPDAGSAAGPLKTDESSKSPTAGPQSPAGKTPPSAATAGPSSPRVNPATGNPAMAKPATAKPATSVSGIESGSSGNLNNEPWNVRPGTASPGAVGPDVQPIPSAGPDPSVRSPGSGLLIVDGVGGTPGAFATLEQACSRAVSGDVIELRYHGPREARPVVLNNLRLTIRALEPFRPVVVFQPGDMDPLKYPRAMLTLNGSQVTFINVALELNVPREIQTESWSLFELRQSKPTRLEKCILTIRNASDQRGAFHQDAAFFRVKSPPGSGLEPDDAPANASEHVAVSLSDCIVRGEASVLHVHDLEPVQFTCDNGLLATSERLLAAEGSEETPLPSDNYRIELRHATVLVRGGLCRFQHSESAHRQLPAQLQCANSIFLGSSATALIEQTGVAAADRYRDRFQWSGERNFYEGFSSFWSVMFNDPELPPEVWAFDAWRSHWSLRQGENLPSLNRVLWRHLPRQDRPVHAYTPADFALSTSSTVSNPALGAATDGRDAGFLGDRLPQMETPASSPFITPPAPPASDTPAPASKTPEREPPAETPADELE